MNRARVGVLISGRGSNMAALLYASRLPDCPYDIVLVASNDPEAAGLTLATAEGVPTFAHAHKGMKRVEFDALIDEQLRAADVEFVALAGYMRLLSPEFIDKWAGRIVNIHPSLLPRYKGLDTHARALDAGDRAVGCSVHVVTAELDDGPVLRQIEVAVLPGDTAETLAARVLIAEHQLYPRALADYVMRDSTPEAKLARVREIALALPGAEETTSHGMPCFRVQGGKMFCYFTHDHHGDGIIAIIVKTSGPDEQAQLIDQDPDVYYRPAYFGPSGWVGVRLDTPDTDWDHVANRIELSWKLVAPRKLLGIRDF
ncbi:putative phosphoribosylglycinamide formyltransferase [Sphingomonas changbaiensis NBRC 104936]|uniref:Phosphoribosylglycinamide formyltransferase n=1 Tax=Sphingomonas changbaiensis NBRC 104936 TaxID=1219043 RepID=A0A0E9MM22_9SPHN|nr:phosphoribosylglycinamide formyltransferase [Sphingomonas changbaiensis]GAO38574.1 putative phosphoribosylglycinamide formyltransferase [Sphingomonas changbaiensis NBRC 104936]